MQKMETYLPYFAGLVVCATLDVHLNNWGKRRLSYQALARQVEAHRFKSGQWYRSLDAWYAARLCNHSYMEGEINKGTIAHVESASPRLPERIKQNKSSPDESVVLGKIDHIT